MSDRTIHLAALKAPFPADRISWRVGSTTRDKKKGMALAYIDARDVMQRLDEVCGPENWQNDYPHAGEKTVCRIGIKIGDEWVWKANGAGNSDIEAEKGALSDAFKRAAVLWGIGQYLYDLESPWVELDTRDHDGKTYVNGIAKSEFTKLHKLLGGKAANQLRKEGSWEELLAELRSDFADCHTTVSLTRLRAEYRGKARDAGWPKQWLDLLSQEFDAQEAALEKAELMGVG
jgi:hypothetical protein